MIPMTGHTIVFTMYGDLSLNPHNVFDIGTNKRYLDTGKWQYSVTHELSDKCEALSKVLDTIGENVSFGLAIPGHVLDTIADHDASLVHSLKTLIEKHDLTVLSIPYYAGFSSVLPEKEFATQVRLHNETVYHVLGISPSTFFTPESPLHSDHIASLAKMGLTTALGPSTPFSSSSSQNSGVYRIEISSDADLLFKSLSSLDSSSLKDVSAAVSPLQDLSGTRYTRECDTDLLKEHVTAELKALYPHIISSGDDTLIGDWRRLSSHPVLDPVSSEDASQDRQQGYEQYMSLMNILNDVAFKIRSVSLASQGVFLTEPEISQSPSSLIDSSVGSGVKGHIE